MITNASYHRDRADQCLEMAQSSTDEEVRRRHEQLAELHRRALDRDEAAEAAAKEPAA